jgi:hypothetical protein
MFISQQRVTLPPGAIQGGQQHCTKVCYKSSAEAVGVEPTEPCEEFSDYKSGGPTDAQRFRSVISISHYHADIIQRK